MDFSGPGIVAAFLGGMLTTSNHGIWFSSEKETKLADMRLEYNPANYWLNRIKDITLECKNRFGSEVVLAIPDLGGSIDILASLRGTENLLMDFYDTPEELKRLINELSGLWHIFFEEIAALYSKDNVYSNWSGLLSRESSYMFQADFAYMIGPEMFNEFLLPELKYSFSKVKRACYHLDGTGQLPHLDSLLQLEDLKLIQWIPGAGTVSVDHWIDVHNKILNAGKLLQACDDREKQLDKIIETRGSLKGVASLNMTFDKKNRAEALRLLEKYS
jgi:5-methyltetrahydrofolate--homocysteine methyltransferase